ncbi:MAG: ABC transporter permease [Candidatus Cloacimonetes bacterium]|nr:ABC transporter permease [Candidatus Cloacimonadota bacterium]
MKLKLKELRKTLYIFATEKTIGFTLISIFLGLVVGAIFLAAAGFNPFQAYWVMLLGVFSKPSYISYTIIRATPLILTGLSIAFAFKTGLFNIGAEGQFIIGSVAATAAGYFLHLPLLIHIPVVIISAVLAAGIWGGIAGYFKAKFGVHEVISTIMLNWIALYFQNFLIYTKGFQKPGGETSYSIQPTANMMILKTWKQSEAGREWLLQHPFWKDLLRTPMNWGFVIAILMAILVWFILNKTALGYRLRAVGFNKFAAEYGGINVNKNMIISMFIAGALAGLAGALQVVGVSHKVTLIAAMEGYGFDGIAVALIANSNALGCILAGLLFGALKYGGTKIQMFPVKAPSEVINIVIGSIVFFISIPKLIKVILTRKNKKEGTK